MPYNEGEEKDSKKISGLFSFCQKGKGDSALMNENRFQATLIKEIKRLLPRAMVFKMDPTYIQGTPDLLILYKKRWAMLECKKSADSAHRPNQDYYIRLLNKMSFARFICPENKKEVLDDMERSLKGFSTKRTCSIQSKPTGMDKRPNG